MAHLPVPFGGLSALLADELVPLDAAIVAEDCEVDDDTLSGRSGSRSVLPGGGAVSGSGLAQGLWRYRPGPTQAVTVAAIGGGIWTVSDPSSEVASDGAATLRGTPFGSSGSISAAQLGRNLYLATDEADVAMCRLRPDYTIETLGTIAQPPKPAVRPYAPLSFTLYRDLADPVTTGTVVYGTSGIPTAAQTAGWRSVTRTGAGDNPDAGVTLQFRLAADFDARAHDWLVIAIVPYDNNSPTGAVEVQLGREVSGSAADLTTVGQTHDVPPIGGSPNLLFCSLLGLPANVREAVRYVKFVLSGSAGGKFALLGHCFLPARALQNPQRYYVTVQNAATGQESLPSEAEEVTVRDADVVLPTYYNLYLDVHAYVTTGAQDDLFSPANRRIFNREAGKAMPARSEVGVKVVIRANLSSSHQAGQTVRLWKETQEGRRLVNSVTLSAGDITAGYVDIEDSGGLSVLSSIRYKAGGTPPRTNALATWQGRLVCGYENQVFISSFLPTDQTSDPYPQFPAIALEVADGWSFYVASSHREQIQGLVGDEAGADALYILTNENCYQLSHASPNSPKFLVHNRGSMGRRAFCWAEGRLFWASWDGVYAGTRGGVEELTRDVRRFYRDRFQPDGTVCVWYQDRKLYVTRGSRQMRYDFVSGRWTGATLGHSVASVAFWRDPAASVQQAWMLTPDRRLTRWQRGVRRDLQVGTDVTSGFALPDWEYSTGYARSSRKTRPTFLLADVVGSPVTVELLKTGDERASAQVEMPVGETERPVPADLVGYRWRLRLRGQSGSRVRSLFWEREELSGRGG